MGAPGASGQQAEQLLESGHQDVVHDVAVDYYGKRLATASSDRLIKLFALSTEDGPSTPLTTLAGHEGPVWQVAWAHPKFGSVLASCSFDRKVILWREGAENDWHQDQLTTDEILHGYGKTPKMLLKGASNAAQSPTALWVKLPAGRCPWFHQHYHSNERFGNLQALWEVSTPAVQIRSGKKTDSRFQQPSAAHEAQISRVNNGADYGSKL